MTDIKITYVFLKTLLFLVFLFSGYLLSKSKSSSQYWKIAIVPIVAFAIVSGLRFGRDIDYNVYYFKYNQYDSSDREVFFNFIVSKFNNLDIPYYLFVLFCSTFLISSFLYLLTKFRKSIFFILPFFLGVMGIENLIRWYFALSFILIAVKLLMDSRYYLAMFMAVLGVLVHSAIVICLLVIVLFYFFANKRILHPIVSVVLFTIFLFLGSTDQLASIASLINHLPILGSSKFSFYLDNAQDIATGGMKSGVYERSLVNNVRIYLSFVFPIYIGGKYLLKHKLQYKKIIWLYNLAVFSIIIMPVFKLVEIFNRISAVLMVFSIIFIGMLTVIAYNRRYSNKLMFKLLLISFLCSVYPILKTPFDRTNDKEMLFIWDANGRKYLPY